VPHRRGKRGSAVGRTGHRTFGPPGYRYIESSFIYHPTGGETISLQRLCRCYGCRPKTMHFKEHTGPAGRLHLNVLWDWPWLNQRELSTLAAACGFGPICHISRVGRPIELAQGRPGSSAAVRYSTKTGFRVVCLRAQDRRADCTGRP
jgi:hypothetical protein